MIDFKCIEFKSFSVIFFVINVVGVAQIFACLQLDDTNIVPFSAFYRIMGIELVLL